MPVVPADAPGGAPFEPPDADVHATAPQAVTVNVATDPTNARLENMRLSLGR